MSTGTTIQKGHAGFSYYCLLVVQKVDVSKVVESYSKSTWNGRNLTSDWTVRLLTAEVALLRSSFFLFPLRKWICKILRIKPNIQKEKNRKSCEKYDPLYHISFLFSSIWWDYKIYIRPLVKLWFNLGWSSDRIDSLFSKFFYNMKIY